jgi:hypothetical protein
MKRNDTWTIFIFESEAFRTVCGVHFLAGDILAPVSPYIDDPDFSVFSHTG